METKDQVLAALKNSPEPLKAGDIAEQTGIDKKEVSKQIKVLVNEGIVHSPKFCYYAPK
jgi:DNA-binding transcriptional regulator GbsR (MarR family)